MQISQDRELFVTDEGSGDPIVMLPGLGGTSSMYQPQVDSLAQHHRVVRIEPAGSGRSPAAGPLSVEGWAQDVGSAVDALDIGSATFVTHSLNTLVVAELVRQRSGLVRSLVALGPVRSQPDQVKEATRARAATVRSGGMVAVVDGVLDMAVSPTARREQPAVTALVRESLLAQPAEGYAASCEALAAAAEPDWSVLSMPVRLVCGGADRLSPPATADAIEQLVPHATRTDCRDAGHWLSVETPDQVTESIEQAATA